VRAHSAVPFTPNDMATEYWSTAILSALLFLGLSTLFTFYRTNSQKSNSELKIPEPGGLSLLTTWSFLSKRDDFLWSNFKKTGAQMFRFRVLQNQVVAMHGTEARKALFGNKALNLPEGYKLFNASPDIREVDAEKAEYSFQSFHKQLADLLSTQRLADVIPSLLADTDRLMAGWGSEGTMDPFKELNDLVFQLTVRLASCRELAEDSGAVARIAQLLDSVERSSTPASLLLPWLPSPARRLKQESSLQLFVLIKSFVEIRRAASAQSSNAIDFLLGVGIEPDNIVEFVLGVIYTGSINTGLAVGWILLYAGVNQEWKDRLAAEFRALLVNHTDAASTDPFHERLASIPLDVWETELPVVDVVIRETLRMVIGLLALRRNLGPDLPIAGKIIPTGDFLAYPIGDVNRNPDIYTDPETFDPHRYDVGREEDKRAPLGYLGWGAGRHVCPGMRIAKLEIKLILAMFISSFDYEVVDGAGQPPKSLPRANFNDFHRPRPMPGNPCYIKFKRLPAATVN